jgi:hypothetical protein
MNKKGENMAVRLLDCISNCNSSNIKELILKGCDLSKPGSKMLSTLLLKTSLKLHHIDVSWNKVQNEGLIELSKGIALNKTLT